MHLDQVQLTGRWAGRRRRDRGHVAQGQVGVPPSLQPRHWVGGAHHCPPGHHDWQPHASPGRVVPPVRHTPPLHTVGLAPGPDLPRALVQLARVQPWGLACVLVGAAPLPPPRTGPRRSSRRPQRSGLALHPCDPIGGRRAHLAVLHPCTPLHCPHDQMGAGQTRRQPGLAWIVCAAISPSTASAWVRLVLQLGPCTRRRARAAGKVTGTAVRWPQSVPPADRWTRGPAARAPHRTHRPSAPRCCRRSTRDAPCAMWSGSQRHRWGDQRNRRRTLAQRWELEHRA